MKKLLKILIATLVLLALVRCSTEAADTGSQTHWFATCTDNRDCDAKSSCQCGICTRSCDTRTDCDGLGHAAECVRTAQAPQCESATLSAVCLPAQPSRPDASAEQTSDDSGAGGTGGTTVETGGGSAQGGSGGGTDSGACAIDATPEPLANPLCGAGIIPASGTVTAIRAATVCTGSGETPSRGYALTVEAPGTPAATVELALGDLPQPFVVGDRIEVLTSHPTEIFQFRLTVDVRKNGVTVVYTAPGVDTRLPPPLTLERGAPLCVSEGRCSVVTLRTVHATSGSVSLDIPPHTHADVGDYRVFDTYAATGVSVAATSCPTDIDLQAFQVAVVRRTPIAERDAGAPDANDASDASR